MLRTLMQVIVVGGLVGVGQAFAGPVATSAGSSWATGAGPQSEAIRIEFRVDPDSAERAEMLADAIADGGLSKRQARDPANAKLFLHLAAGARDAQTIAVALEGMGRTWSRTGRGKRPKIDEDFINVVSGRLRDKTPRVRAGALAAARLILAGKKSNEAMLKRVIKMAGAKGAADRVAAMQALFNVRAFQLPKKTPGDRKARIVAVHLANLDDKQPHVVAVALKNLGRAAYPGMPQKAALQDKARALVKHESPAIRGTALQLVAGLAGKGDLSKGDGALLRAALHDPDAHVRAAAAMAIAKAKYLAGAHALMGMLEDGAKSELNIKGFTALNGKKGKVPLRAHAPRVDETVLESLRRMTAKTPYALKFERLGVKDRAANRAAAVATTRKWYDANKGKLPKAPAPTAPAAPQ